MTRLPISEIADWSQVCRCSLVSQACLPSWFLFWAALPSWFPVLLAAAALSLKPVPLLILISDLGCFWLPLPPCLPAKFAIMLPLHSYWAEHKLLLFVLVAAFKDQDKADQSWSAQALAALLCLHFWRSGQVSEQHQCALWRMLHQKLKMPRCFFPLSIKRMWPSGIVNHYEVWASNSSPAKLRLTMKLAPKVLIGKNIENLSP